MIYIVDKLLNRITMYRLVIYCLAFLLVVGLIVSFFGILPFNPLDLLISVVIIFTFSVLINYFFERLFKSSSNPESTYITALILSLVSGPEKSLKGYAFLVVLCALAISSKYVIAINKKHFFNPAAFSIVILALFSVYYPSWWIGDKVMIYFVLLTGLLITRKLQRFDLALSFLAVFILTSISSTSSIQQIVFSLKSLFTYSPILFFTFVMLTEPSTTPPKRVLRIIYGSLTAILIAPFFNIGPIYFTPELALITANIFSFLVSPKIKLILSLNKKRLISKNTYEFDFTPDRKMNFKAGQYMEFTIKHNHYDARGVRRYFTIASSPTEDSIKLGVKFYPVKNSPPLGPSGAQSAGEISNGVYGKSSTFKKSMAAINIGDKIIASQLSGEFTLPKNNSKKLIFIAGGIGITPFRSMVKYLIDNNEKRDIVLFYAVNSYEDIAYKEIFDEAEIKLGIKTIYILRDLKNIPEGLRYYSGIIDKKTIENEIHDFKERLFYISGPKAMIDTFEKILKELNISKLKVKTDFFPGYA